MSSFLARILTFVIFIRVTSTGFGATSAYKLFDVSCKPTERATGCEAPFKKCDLGVSKSIVETCLQSARNQRCSNFTWEKCCATNCFIRNGGKTMIGTEKCMERCSKHAAASHYGPASLHPAQTE